MGIYTDEQNVLYYEPSKTNPTGGGKEVMIVGDTCCGKMHLERGVLCMNDGQKMGSLSEQPVFIVPHIH